MVILISVAGSQRVLPRELLRPSSLLTNLVLDETRSSSPRLTATCDHIFAYISDTVAPGEKERIEIVVLLFTAFF